MNFTEIRLTNDDELVLLPFEAENDSRFFYYKKELIDMSKLENYIINFSSTNGLYTFIGSSSGKDEINPTKIRFFFATDEFINSLYNDKVINTMGSNQKLFYQGKYVKSKVFVKKLLSRSRDGNKESLEFGVIQDKISKTYLQTNTDEIKELLKEINIPKIDFPVY